MCEPLILKWPEPNKKSVAVSLLSSSLLSGNYHVSCSNKNMVPDCSSSTVHTRCKYSGPSWSVQHSPEELGRRRDYFWKANCGRKG